MPLPSLSTTVSLSAGWTDLTTLAGLTQLPNQPTKVKCVDKGATIGVVGSLSASAPGAYAAYQASGYNQEQIVNGYAHLWVYASATTNVLVSTAEQVEAVPKEFAPVVPAEEALLVWPDPTVPFDARKWGSVSIWCFVAPASARVINWGDGAANMIPATPVDNAAAGITTPVSISAVGRFTLAGGCWISLAAGTGTFMIGRGN